MTNITLFLSRAMATRQAMATGATTQNLQMIHREGPRPRSRPWKMTGLTDVGRVDVTGGQSMAAGTSTQNLRVVYRAGGHRQPADA